MRELLAGFDASVLITLIENDVKTVDDARLLTVDDCKELGFSSVNAEVGFTGDFMENATTQIDMRPSCGSAAYQNIQALPEGDTFFVKVGFKGAFGNDNWLAGWSYLDVTSRLAKHELTCAPGTTAGPQIPAWGIALFIVVAVLMVLVCVFVMVMIQREKASKPIFMPFEGGKKNKGDVEIATVSGDRA